MQPQRNRVVIDENSGFCAGVINAIRTAEDWLAREGSLYCLGDIVHNNEEMQRLAQLGLKVITHEQMRELRQVRVLIRAHGEPPETYELAEKNHIEIIDATCKVVLNLQKTIKQCFENKKDDGQVLIFGKQGHAEVIGLQGQTNGRGIVLSDLNDVEKIDFNRPAHLFSQTTQNAAEYRQLVDCIADGFSKNGNEQLFAFSDTICHSVVNRAKQIGKFAEQHDVIIFVSGEQSSNGLYLYNICKKHNPRCYFISHLKQLSEINVSSEDSIGICGATSTPMWLMKDVQHSIENNINN